MNRHAWLRSTGILIKLIAVPMFLGFVADKLLNAPHIGLFKMHLWWLIAALAVNQIALCLFALRMRLVLRIFTVHLSYLQSLRIHLQSMLYYFIVPMTVGLEAARFAKIKTRLGDGAHAVNLGSALVGDRLIGALAAVVWAAALLPVISLHLIVKQKAWTLPLIVTGAVCAGCVALALLHGRVRFYAMQLIKLFHAGRSVLVLSLLVALLTQLCFALAVYLAVRGAGLEIGFIQVLFAISAAMLFIVIPVSFAGVGPAEAAAVGVMVGMGIPLEQAGIFALLTYFARLVAAFEGGVWELCEGWGEASRHLATRWREGRSNYD